MAATFSKLKVKGHDEILVLNSPPSFETELAGLKGVVVHYSPAKMKRISFLLAFVTSASDIEKVAPVVAAKAEGDPMIWVAYPKKTSKKYRSTIDRDSGWDALSAVGFRGVAMIAIDDDWSAKRVRRLEYVKPTASQS
jgi:hypothetical protein